MRVTLDLSDRDARDLIELLGLYASEPFRGTAKKAIENALSRRNTEPNCTRCGADWEEVTYTDHENGVFYCQTCCELTRYDFVSSKELIQAMMNQMERDAH